MCLNGKCECECVTYIMKSASLNMIEYAKKRETNQIAEYLVI